MKQKLSLTLLFVVLFVLATSTLFAQSRDYSNANITVEIFDNATPVASFWGPNSGGDAPEIFVGYRVDVTLTDPDWGAGAGAERVISASIDFGALRNAAATPTIVNMVPSDPEDGIWRASYTIQPGDLDGTLNDRNFVTTAYFYNVPSSRTLINNVNFQVNNFTHVISGQHILTSLVSPGTGGVAIIGSRINVSIPAADLVHPTQPISSVTANFQSFGALAPVAMVLNPDNARYEGFYDVVAGTDVGSFPVSIVVNYTGIVSPSQATSNNVIAVNNVAPTAGLMYSRHLAVNGVNTLSAMKIGDSIHVIGTFLTAGDAVVDRVWINWGATFTGGPVTAYPVVGGVLQNASYTPAAGSIAGNIANLGITVQRFRTVVGNEADVTFIINGNGASPSQPIVCDLLPPDITGAIDLSYELTNLRFSPNVNTVDGIETTPNTFNINLTIPTWGAVNGATSLTLRFEHENTRSVFFRTYTAEIVDPLNPPNLIPNPAITNAGGGVLTIIWDGRDNNGNILAPLATDNPRTYGITLWDIQDEVGNSAVLTQPVDGAENGDYTGVGHLINDGAPNNFTGTTYLNRLHVVVDNKPLGIVQDLNPVGHAGNSQANPVVLTRYIDGAVTNYVTDYVDFAFQVSRDYQVNTEDGRKEKGYYWVVLENQSVTPVTRTYYNGTAWTSYATPFTPEAGVNIANIVFPDQPHSGDNNSAVTTARWTISGAANEAVYTPGTYKAYSFFRDNAGNIVRSQDVYVKIEHENYALPAITAVAIDSEHDNGDGVGLAPYTPALPDPTAVRNFYLTAAYAPADNFTGNYYETADVIDIKISVNNRNNLKEINAAKVDLTALLANPLAGPQWIVWLDRADFNLDGNTTALVRINASDLAVNRGALAPGVNYTVGQLTDDITVTVFDRDDVAPNGIGTANTTSFNLVIPPKNNAWINPITDNLSLAVTNQDFSPGNPTMTYDSVTNPARDGNNDTTTFSFAKTNVSDVRYVLEVKDNGDVKRSWMQDIVLATPNPITVLFNGLANDGTLIASATERKELDVSLVIQPAPTGGFTDPGYVLPTLYNASLLGGVVIDNQNPVIAVGNDVASVNGRVLTMNEIPVASELSHSFTFTVNTNDYLPAAAYVAAPLTNGWRLNLYNSNGTALLNGALTVGVNISDIEGFGIHTGEVVYDADGVTILTDSRLWKSFNITANFTNLINNFEYDNAILHIILPNDPAGNPGRINNPAYPFTQDVYHNDSAEFFTRVDFVNPDPVITNITLDRVITDAPLVTENTNVLYEEMGTIIVTATVTTGTPLPTFPLTYWNSKLATPAYVSTGIPAPVAEISNVNEMTYTWTIPVANLTGLDWTYAENGPRKATFRFNVQNAYTQTSTYTHEMVILSEAYFRNYSVRNERNFDGTTPDGWFAPENSFMSISKFYSLLNNAIAPVMADFDYIVDNVPEEFIAPTSTDVEEVTVNLTQGGSTVPFTVYDYTATWDITPDYVSVWAHYADGDDVDIDYVYHLTPYYHIETVETVKVDKEHPVYNKTLYYVAIANTTLIGPATPNYQLVGPGVDGDYKELTLLLDVQEMHFPVGKSIYVRVYANDGLGVGVGWLGNPTATGWAVEVYEDYDLASGYIEYKLTPNNPAAITASTTTNLTLGYLEDLVGHKNYIAQPTQNINSELFTATAPVITFRYTTDTAATQANVVAYQKLANPQDMATAPYIRPGQPLGVRMTLANRNGRGIDVKDVIPHAVAVYTPATTEPLAINPANWLALTHLYDDSDLDNIIDYWWLDAPGYNIPANTTQNLGTYYKITYKIEYNDGPDTFEDYVSEWIPEFVKIDNQSPVLADQTIKLRSKNYAVTDYYVIPGDYAELEILFTDEAYNYSTYGNTAKPTVIVKDLASFIEIKKYDAQGDPVLDVDDNFIYEAPVDHVTLGGWEVPARYITRTGNQWKVEIKGEDLRAKSKSSAPFNSQIITVDIYDTVGNTKTTATRFIEIAEETIVPIIVDNDMINLSTPTILGPVNNIFAPLATYPTSQPVVYSTVTVEIDVAQDYYVDGIELTVPGYENHFDITYTGLSPKFDAGVPVPNKRIATFQVRSSDTYNVTASSVNFQVRVWRSPYGMPVYEQTRTFNVQIDNPVFSGGTITSVSNVNPAITNYIKPGSQFEAIMTFPRANIVGKSGKDLVAAVQSTVQGWFTLSSTQAMSAQNITVNQDITHGATMTLKWRANAKSPIADGDVVATFNARVRNVYGFEIRTAANPVTRTGVNVDKNAPVIANNGIAVKAGTANVIPPFNFSTNTVSVFEDFTEITVTLNDPVITGVIAGTGITGARLRLVPTGTTYTGTSQMVALAGHAVTFTNASGAATAILSFKFSDITGITSAYDLSVGMYNIIIDNITDRIGNTGLTYTQPFYFNPAETSITLSEFANGTHIVNLSEATSTENSRHLLEALVNDPSGTVNGVRFNLYYDWQNKYANAANHFNPEAHNPLFNLSDYDNYVGHLSYGSVNATEELWDNVPPYQANWNLHNGTSLATAHRNIYNWVPQVGANPFYPRTGTGATLATDPVRYFLVRMTSITQSRYIYEDYVRVGVRDDVAPVPNYPTFQLEVFYSATPAQNNLNITTNFTNWPDVKSVAYQMKTLDGLNVGNPIVVLNPALTAASPSSYVNTNATDYTGNWNFDAAGTGRYTFTVTTTDYSGNSATFEYDNAEIWIKNPAFGTSYTLTLSNVNPTNDDVFVSSNYAYDADSDIPSNVTYYGADYADVIGEIRANVTFGAGLSGISRFRLRKNTYNKVTGRWTNDVPVTNLNDSYYHGDNNDYVIDNEGWVIVVDENGFNQFHNISSPINLYLFIPESNYATAVNNDLIHEFYVELDPLYPFYSDEEIEEFKENNYDYRGFGIDNRAPRILNVSVDYPVAGINKMSWAMPATFRAYPDRTYDFFDVVNNATIPLIEWKLPSWDDEEWKTAVITGERISGEDIESHFRYTNWNVSGGSIATFLGPDFEGIVNLRLHAVDALGNEHYQPFNVFVDNKAPDTRFTHVMHGINYPALTQIPNNSVGPDSIWIQNSLTGNGKADLRLFVDASTLNSDAVMPLRVYQQKPNGTWMAPLYDHEAWNLGVAGNPDLYEFTIPTTHQEAGNHRFIVATYDILGNLEGDLAGNLAEYIVIDEEAIGYDEEFDYVSALAKYFAYDANLGTSWLDPENAFTYVPDLGAFVIAPGYYLPRFNERQVAVDLIVHVEYINDVIAKVDNPSENNIIAGYKVFTADTFDYDNPNNISVDDREKVSSMRFERKVGNAWTTVSTVAKADSFLVTFELLRSDIPQFDGLPWVPGIHVTGLNKPYVPELIWNDEYQKWSGNVWLEAGIYNYQFGLDLNNDGTYNDNTLISDPKNTTWNGAAFVSVPLVVKPWSLVVDTRNYAQGIHEFRAVPLDENEQVLQYRQSPSTWVFIDNIAPVVNNISAEPVGIFYSAETSPYGDEAVHAVKFGTEVPFNFDVNELLVNTDDNVELYFQWSGQPVQVGTNDVYYRKWHTANFAGNVWTARNPLTDLIDNDLLNGIDNPEEANSFYYIRFAARDRAGNFALSEEYKILVDASPAYMQITSINDLQINHENDNEINIFNLPADTTTPVIITALDITEDFDPANTATIKYQYKASYYNAWGVEKTLPVLPATSVNVVNGQALFTLPADEVLEGYFRFRASGADVHGNEGNGNWVTVLFNDADAHADMTFLSFNNGERRVLPYEGNYYLFSNGDGAINGTVNILLANDEDINFMAIEYSIDGEDWYQSVSTTTIGNNITIPGFVAPNIRATQFFIRAKARDINNNLTYSDVVTVYNNVGSTDVVLTYTDFNGAIVELPNLDIEDEEDSEYVYAFDLNAFEDDDEITFNVAYENHPVAPFNIVNQLVLSINETVIYNTRPEAELEEEDLFDNIYPKATSFTFTKAELLEKLGINGHVEDIFMVTLTVNDHAGNSNIQDLEPTEDVIIDTKAPVFAIDSVNVGEDELVAVSNTYNALYNQTLEFVVEYADLIGLYDTGALNVTFTHRFSSTYIVTQTVSNYELYTDEGTDYLVFNWTPSAAIQHLVLNGQDALDFNVAIEITDRLGNTSEALETNVRLHSGHHSFVRLMVVTDKLADVTNRRINYVNWNASPAEVLEEVGTNRTGTPEPVKLYAYAPHNAQLPSSVRFEYRRAGFAGAVWNEIDETNVVNTTPIVNGFGSEYTVDWAIETLIHGTYEVRTIAEYAYGEQVSEIALIHVYNQFITPQVVVTDEEYVSVSQIERGEDYLLNVDFADDEDARHLYQIVYHYKYVRDANNPYQNWSPFVVGFDPQTNNPINNDWHTVSELELSLHSYYHYFYNENIMVIALAKDKWGTVTPVHMHVDAANYAIAQIVDTIAPVVTETHISWNDNNNPAWVSGLIEEDIEVFAKIESNLNPHDIDFVQIYVNNELIDTFDYDNNELFNYLLGGAQEYVKFDLTLPAGVDITAANIKVVAVDNAGNGSEPAEFVINIDNELPVTNIRIINEAGIELDTIVNGQTVILDAQASDMLSGLATVQYQYATDAEFTANVMDINETIITNAPYRFTWEVEGLEMGVNYFVRAIVRDNVGNVTEGTPAEYNTGIAITHVTVGGTNYDHINGVIPRRLHGQFTVVSNAAANVPQMNVLFRHIDSAEYLTLSNDYYVYNAVNNHRLVMNLNNRDLIEENFANGQYVIALATQNNPLVPVAQVVISLDSELEVLVQTTDIEYMNEETDFVVNFTVLADSDNHIDNISDSNVALLYQSYNNTDNENWYVLEDVTKDLTASATNNGINWSVLFTDFDMPYGRYNFMIRVQDNAIPNANVREFVVSENVLFDNVVPVVDIVSVTVDNNELIDDDPIFVRLGETVSVTAEAFDYFADQTVTDASGVAYVNFWYEREDNVEVFIAQVTEAPYTISLNTLGFLTGEYTVYAQAFDNAGNESEEDHIHFTVITPLELEPYALITAMSFNVNEHHGNNVDKLQAALVNWNNENVDIDFVEFQYYNGNTWTTFYQFEGNFAAGQTYDSFTVPFNAELMNVQKLRTRVIYNEGFVSSRQPELAVTYANYELVPANQTITADLYWESQVHIAGSNNKPIVHRVYNDAAANLISTVNINLVDGIWQAPFTVNQVGTHHFWAASLGADGNMQLAKTSLDVYANGDIVTDGVVTVTVPTDYLYIQNLVSNIALPENFNALSAQRALFTNNDEELIITMALNTVPAEEGIIVAMYWDGAEWIHEDVEPVYNAVNNTVTFNAPAGNVYVVAQYAAETMHASFHSFTPQYVDANDNYWTNDDAFISFFVHGGEDGLGGTWILQNADIRVYVDGLLYDHIHTTDGLVTADISELEAGVHNARIVVQRNGFTVIADKEFHVDTTVPVITATGSQLTIENRTVSAQITDVETGVAAVDLTLSSGSFTIYVPRTSIMVNGDIYSYELTYEDLYFLNLTNGGTDNLIAYWTAENNLEMSTGNLPGIVYTVNIATPVVAFTGGENGWWINPSQGTQITFNVTVPQGRIMPADGVEVEIYEFVNQVIDGVVVEDYVYTQTMTLSPVSSTGNVYNYLINYGMPTSPRTTAVTFEVIAIDNYDTWGFGEQVYGIDYVAPVVWALSPVGDIIDADAFPPTYESAVLPYGANATIGIAFQDITGFYTYVNEVVHFWATWEDFIDAGLTINQNLIYYTAASGINPSSVTVYLNGEEIEGNITNGNFVSNQGILEPGIYTVTASVADYSGNTGSLSYTFTVVGGAPTITFNPVYNGQYWINALDTNELSFVVNSDNMMAEGGVVANIYAEPSNTIIQGPITPALANGVYTISLEGGIVPAGQTAVRLEVIATDVWGGQSTSNQSYGIDNHAPVVTFISPMNNAEVVYSSVINISATISDLVNSRKDSERNSRNDVGSLLTNATDRTAGSGIASAVLTITNPAGEETVHNYGANTQNINRTVNAAHYGNYTFTITALDNAGNEGMATVTVNVVGSAATVTYNPINNGTYWLNSNDVNEFTFSVESNATIAVGGVVANVYSVPANELVQGPVTPALVAGQYKLTVQAGVIPSNQTGVRLEVKVTDVFGGQSTSNQTYGIDNHAPTITIVSPVADAQFAINHVVNIMANVSDVIASEKSAPGFEAQTARNANNIKAANSLSLSSQLATVNNDRSAGSGIASVNLRVVGPNGAEVHTQNYPANTQVVSHALPVTAYGIYTVYITAVDRVDNQSIQSVSFAVVPASVPTVTFNELNGNGWWLGNGNNQITFSVQSELTVVAKAKVIAQPSGDVISGPVTVNPSNGLYTVNLHSSLIPVNATSVEVEVVVTDLVGLTGTYTQTYNVDRVAPVITVFSPRNGSEFTLTEALTAISVNAEFVDLAHGAAKGAKSQMGSGIASARLVMTNPNNTVSTLATTGTGVHEIAAIVENLMLGTYTIQLTVHDRAGNSVTDQIQFTIVPVPVIPAELVITEAFIYPNPMNTEEGANFRLNLSANADVQIRIYDFAGREVRSIYQYAGGKSNVDIKWDGRNENGTKLARGAYFARITANDGKKIVETVVKVAITN